MYRPRWVLLTMPFKMNHNLKSKFGPLSDLEERIGENIVGSAIKIHRKLGPGLLEKIYEICLAHELEKAGFSVKRQSYIPVTYDSITFKEGLRLDLLVNDLVVEIKAVENVNPVWHAQVLSHLKLTSLRLGYLLNFTVPLMKHGIRRFRNG